MAHSGRNLPLKTVALALALAALGIAGVAEAKPRKAAPAPVAKVRPAKSLQRVAYHPPTAARLAPAESIPRMPTTVTDSGPEPLLARIFKELEGNRLDEALRLTENLVGQFPNFRLGHLIKGDLLLARAQPIAGFGALNGAPGDKVADLRAEAIARL